MTVAMLAALADMRETRFLHAFKRQTGMSPYRYVLHKRLERATGLLTGSSVGTGRDRPGYRVCRSGAYDCLLCPAFWPHPWGGAAGTALGEVGAEIQKCANLKDHGAHVRPISSRRTQEPSMFKRKLNRVETIALSVAVIAMMVGISLNTPFIAATAGTAVPLVFVISTIGVLCIALSFVRLASKVGHAGSVYGLIYYAQGRNFGFIAGWAILLTYAVFVTAALCGFGLFASGLLAPVVNIPWPVYAIACAFLVWFITDRDIKLSTRLMLTIELFSVTLVLILSIIIVSVTKFTPAPFHPGSSGIGGLSQGLVFGVLTFIGFEAASSLGEEAQNPVRDVPFAIITTVLVAGAFFTFVGYAQTVGYGLANITKFAGAAAPFQDLAPQYGGAVMAGSIQFGALVSTFAMAVGSAAAAARLLVALARDGFLPAPPGQREPVWLAARGR